MIAAHHDTANNNLTAIQRKSFLRFKKKLAQELPALRIAWVHPFNDTIIELHLEYDKRTYRKSLKASKLAVEVEDETGVTIILR
jgi:hypothetical protein